MECWWQSCALNGVLVAGLCIEWSVGGRVVHRRESRASRASRGATMRRGVRARRRCTLERLREDVADSKRNNFKNLYQNRLDGPIACHVLVQNSRFLKMFLVEIG